MIKLFQFPISHYCEKIRWALDYKQLTYQTINMLPGLHINQLKKLGVGSSVPVLAHEGNIIQGSDRIISYLDERFPERSLTPENDELRIQAQDWEAYADSEIGPHLRRCAYHILLDHPNIVIPFFAHKGPWYGRVYLRLVFPKLRNVMRKFMDINTDRVEASHEKLQAAVDRLDRELKTRKFLVGDAFSRADLSAAALLAPFCMPDQYGLNWPSPLPQDYEILVNRYKPKIGWVDQLYGDYR